jgi:RND family efflux transporter MFP subunit
MRFAISTSDYLSMFGSLDKLKSEAQISLQLADGSICSEAGQVEFLDNQANSHTDSVIIYALFPNADGRLIAGSTVTVTLSRRNGDVYPAVPLSAIQLDKDGTSVFVVNEAGRAEPRRVVVGGIAEGLQTIESGLTAGETIVSSGTHKVMPNMKIVPAGKALEE